MIRSVDRGSDGQGIELLKLQTEVADPVVCRGRQHAVTAVHREPDGGPTYASRTRIHRLIPKWLKVGISEDGDGPSNGDSLRG
ncbi:hypothetical protein SBA3_1160003 [Candidatus Sulfopaludibacter sp. SbA3]|nr:hypothetical protein SBA3_1160003 [Candidatus Sulfopaludibacter sp. SbA3]